MEEEEEVSGCPPIGGTLPFLTGDSDDTVWSAWAHVCPKDRKEVEHTGKFPFFSNPANPTLPARWMDSRSERGE